MVNLRSLLGAGNGVGRRDTSEDLREHLLPTHRGEHVHTTVPAERLALWFCFTPVNKLTGTLTQGYQSRIET